MPRFVADYAQREMTCHAPDEFLACHYFHFHPCLLSLMPLRRRHYADAIAPPLIAMMLILP